MKSYEVILFDADETLFDFKKTEREAFKNTMMESGWNDNRFVRGYYQFCKIYVEAVWN